MVADEYIRVDDEYILEEEASNLGGFSTVICNPDRIKIIRIFEIIRFFGSDILYIFMYRERVCVCVCERERERERQIKRLKRLIETMKKNCDYSSDCNHIMKLALINIKIRAKWLLY